jgi:hypothetical protein
MIKSIIASLLAIGMVAAPIAAEARDRNHHHRKGVSTGEAVAIGIGALIVGAALSKRDRKIEREVYDREYEYHYRRTCREIISTGYDRYGDYYEKRTIRCND